MYQRLREFEFAPGTSGYFRQAGPHFKVSSIFGGPPFYSTRSTGRRVAVLLGDVPPVTSHVEPTEMTNFSTDDNFGASQPLFGNVTVTL
jgi:hypothetical protein